MTSTVPNDIWVYCVYDFLDIPELFALNHTSKHFKKLVEEWLKTEKYLDHNNHFALINRVPYYNGTINDFFKEYLTLLGSIKFDVLYSKENKMSFIDHFKTPFIKIRKTETTPLRIKTEADIVTNFRATKPVTIVINGLEYNGPLETFTYLRKVALFCDCTIKSETPYQIEYDEIYLNNYDSSILTKQSFDDVYTKLRFINGCCGPPFESPYNSTGILRLMMIYSLYVQPFVNVLSGSQFDDDHIIEIKEKRKYFRVLRT